MKIDRASPTAAPSTTSPSTPAETRAPAPPRAWGSDGPAPARDDFRVGAARETPLEAARQALAGHALAAVTSTLAAQTGQPAHFPLLEKFGEGLGLGLGAIVTEALRLVPSWNTPVLDAQGKPAEHIEGADRLGQHALLKRHQEVVGPKVTALVQTLAPGVVRELLEGLGKGATEAPGASYRLESALADLL